MKKEYYDLLESLYWIAFRTPTPPKHLIMENDKLLAESAKLLYGYLTPDFNEFLSNNDEIIAVAGVENYGTNQIDEVNITSFAPDMEIYATDDMVVDMGGRYYYGVCLLADKLREAFPPLTKEPNSIARRDSPAHDIAFYYYDKHKPIQAKSLSKLLADVLPGFNISVPELNTVKAWLTTFNKKTYQPTTSKQQICQRYPRIFEKFRNANREI